MIDDEAIVRILGEEIPGLVAAYRFGSTVTATQNPSSDVDVAVLGSAALKPLTRLRIAGRLSGALHRDVDLVDLYGASTVLRMEVVGKGIALPVGDERR
ncbi:MAG: nucleotidyltransferase domain-containing protein, partial [Planctomycetota bacterium]